MAIEIELPPIHIEPASLTEGEDLFSILTDLPAIGVPDSNSLFSMDLDLPPIEIPVDPLSGADIEVGANIIESAHEVKNEVSEVRIQKPISKGPPIVISILPPVVVDSGDDHKLISVDELPPVTVPDDVTLSFLDAELPPIVVPVVEDLDAEVFEEVVVVASPEVPVSVEAPDPTPAAPLTVAVPSFVYDYDGACELIIAQGFDRNNATITIEQLAELANVWPSLAADYLNLMEQDKIVGAMDPITGVRIIRDPRPVVNLTSSLNYEEALALVIERGRDPNNATINTAQLAELANIPDSLAADFLNAMQRLRVVSFKDADTGVRIIIDHTPTAAPEPPAPRPQQQPTVVGLNYEEALALVIERGRDPNNATINTAQLAELANIPDSLAADYLNAMQRLRVVGAKDADTGVRIIIDQTPIPAPPVPPPPRPPAAPPRPPAPPTAAPPAAPPPAPPVPPVGGGQGAFSLPTNLASSTLNFRQFAVKSAPGFVAGTAAGFAVKWALVAAAGHITMPIWAIGAAAGAVTNVVKTIFREDNSTPLTLGQWGMVALQGAAGGGVGGLVGEGLHWLMSQSPKITAGILGAGVGAFASLKARKIYANRKNVTLTKNTGVWRTVLVGAALGASAGCLFGFEAIRHQWFDQQVQATTADTRPQTPRTFSPSSDSSASMNNLGSSQNVVTKVNIKPVPVKAVVSRFVPKPVHGMEKIGSEALRNAHAELAHLSNSSSLGHSVDKVVSAASSSNNIYQVQASMAKAATSLLKPDTMQEGVNAVYAGARNAWAHGLDDKASQGMIDTYLDIIRHPANYGNLVPQPL